jgi:hypothetical protein
MALPLVRQRGIDSILIMGCSRLFILMLALSKSEASQRSLNNIFNRTNTKQRDDGTGTLSNSNGKSKLFFDQHTEINNDREKSLYKTSDVILPQRRRRLGVGAKNKRPSDDFMEGNENMHRFFDKITMSMATEVSTLNNTIYIRIDISCCNFSS